jgi:phosphate/sulfate permease
LSVGRDILVAMIVTIPLSMLMSAVLYVVITAGIGR